MHYVIQFCTAAGHWARTDSCSVADASLSDKGCKSWAVVWGTGPQILAARACGVEIGAT